MSALSEHPTCEAIVADFAWFSQRCHEPSVAVVDVDGEFYGVCEFHDRTHSAPSP